jgi:hypothetical protein
MSSSLTEASIATRKFIIISLFVLLGYIMFKFFIFYAKNYIFTPKAKPPPPPNVLFGKLPYPDFSQIATVSANMKFYLQTIDGNPPETTDAARIFSMPKKLRSYYSEDRAKNLAKKLGFTEEPSNKNSTYFAFVNSNDPLLSLLVDIVNLNFDYKFNYTRKQEVFKNNYFSSKDQAISVVKNFINRNALIDESFLNGNITTVPLSYNNSTNSFSIATSLSTANCLRINFFRKDIEGIPVLSPDKFSSYNYAIYTSNEPQIIEISYTYWPIAFDDSATYPLRTTETAWQNLVEGNGYVINMGTNNPNKITVRNIYLAYFDSKKPQNYLQPVFVFEGDNDFIAYVPAVSPEWLE